MMATKSKDSANTNVGKKEKVVPTTTSSNSQTKANSTKPTTSSSTKASSSSSTEKQIPNYLKPTISSRHDSAPVGPKPALNRRRSFDNKPPPSRPPSKAPSAAHQPVRSSSFTRGSSRAPLRGAGPKPSPQTTLYAKTAKKGSGEAFVRKEGPSARADHKVACEPRKAVDGCIDQEVKIKGDDRDHDQNEVEAKTMHHDIPVVVSEELAVKSDDDHDHDHHDPGDNVVVGVVEEAHHDNKFDEVVVEEEDEEKNGDSSESRESGDQEISLDNVVASEDEANVVEELVKVEEEIKEEEEEEDTISEGRVEINKTSNEVDDDNDNDNCNDDGEINAKDSEEEEDNSSDRVDVVEDETEEKIDEIKSTSSSSEKKAQGSGGKKESQIAYNDVIEETASKLLEKRKNKVKALVGAFETVIDYESK